MVRKLKRVLDPEPKQEPVKINNEDILSFFNSPHLRLNKNIIQAYSVDIALWIADVFSRWNYFNTNDKLVDGFFFVSQNEIRQSTSLNFNKQTDIIKTLSKDEIIEVKKAGLPARNFYKVNTEKLIAKVNKISSLNQKELELYNRKDKLFKLEGYNNNKNNNNKVNKNKISSKEDIVSAKPTPSNKTFLETSDFGETVQSLFQHWQSLSIVKHIKSKTRDSALKQLNTKSKHYSPRVIKQAMNKYKELLDDPYSKLFNKKAPYKVGLNNFFKFDEFNKIKGYKDIENIKSWFDECIKEDQQHLMKISKDEYPKLTNKLKKEYKANIGEFKPNDENTFRKASVLLTSFLNKNKTKLYIDVHKQRSPIQFSSLLFECLSERKGNGIHPGWLCASFEQGMFSEWLVKNNYVLTGKKLL